MIIHAQTNAEYLENSHYDNGINLLKSKKYYEAAREFNIAILLEPYNTNAILKIEELKNNITDIYLRQLTESDAEGKYEDEISSSIKYVSINPYESDFRRNIKNLYSKIISRADETSQEKEQYENQSKAWEFLDVGLESFYTNDFDSAYGSIKESLNIYDFAIAYLYIGIILYCNDDYEGAKANFTKAIELDNDIYPPPDIGPQIWRVFCEAKGEELSNIPTPLDKQNAIIVLKSIPTEANIYINGNIYNKKTDTILELSPGKYQLEIKKTGYRVFTNSMNLHIGINSSISRTMEEEQGKLVITSKPENSLIFIDSNLYKDHTPTEITLKPDKYRIKLTLDDHVSYEETVGIYDQEIKKLNAILLEKTKLRLVSIPPKVEITLKGLNKYTTPIFIDSINPGLYQLNAKAKYYKKTKQELEVKPNRLNYYELRLVPKSRIESVLLSLVFPGLGQCYAGNYKIGLAFSFAGISAIGFLADSYYLYDHAVKDYDRAIRLYSNAFYIEEINMSRRELLKTHEQKDTTIKYMEISSIILGTIYILNVLHSAFFSPL